MSEWAVGGLGRTARRQLSTQSAGLASNQQGIFTAIADVPVKATDKSLSTRKIGALLCATTNLGATRSGTRIVPRTTTYSTLSVWNSPKSHRCPHPSHS